MENQEQSKPMIPIIDCPACHAVDVPLSYEGTYQKEGEEDVVIFTCTNCGAVPNMVAEVQIKKWLSLEELEKLGWQLQEVTEDAELEDLEKEKEEEEEKEEDISKQ
jgi:RNase P subunit RPR2